jgi:hypothetical protein
MRRRTPWIAAAIAVPTALLIAASAAPLVAQSILVRVRAEPAGQPIAGALVSLRDAKRQLVARVLAGERGEVRLAAPPGRYALRIDAIGFEGRDTVTAPLGDGAVVVLDVRLTPRPLDLGELVVHSTRPAVCRMSEERGTSVAHLWDEARKALESTELTRNEGPLLDIRTFRRDLDIHGRIRDERSDTRRANSTRPFQAVDPTLLDREGYVRHVGGDTWYHGPDAELLLSEPFLASHCFSVIAPGRRGDSSLVGLEFRPVPSRHLPDVSGVLWLDARSAELRAMEFDYTNVRLPADARDVGGTLRFARIAGGGWIIDDWTIRMPRVVRIRGSVGSRDSIAGYREAGGTARLASAADTRTASTVLEGQVVDSTTGLPLAGVEVSVQAGAFADTTDQDGRYRLRSPGQGHYVVTISDPRLTLLGRDALQRAARLDRRQPDTLDVAVPLFDAAVRALCPADTARTTTGVMIGSVADSASGGPVAGAAIRVRFVSYRFVNASGVGERGKEIETSTDRNGLFAACGLPLDKEVTVTVQTAGRPARLVTRIGDQRLATPSIRVP